MITMVRSANIHDGKSAEAIAFAIKMTSYLRDKLGHKVHLARNIGGHVYQIHFVSAHESLAELEQTARKTEADEGYKSLLAESRQKGFFVATSIVDSLYENIG